MTTTETSIDLSRPCTTCKGEKVRPCLFCNRFDRNHPGKLEDGRVCFCVRDKRATGTPGFERCNGCDGAGIFVVPVFGWLAQGVLASRGKNKGTLAVSRPKLADDRTVEGARLYYVWRLTRFHAGKDVTMPIMAEHAIKGDPYRAELDACAALIAQRLTGRSSIGAARWRGALFGTSEVDAGMPWERPHPAAEPGGPVVTEGKPETPWGG